MRILILIPNYPPITAGAELFVKNLVEYLSQKKEEVHIVTRKVKDYPKEENTGYIHIYRTSLNQISNFQSANNNLYMVSDTSFLAIKTLVIIKKIDADIIHSHGAISNFIAVICGKLYRKPVITTVQGGDLADYSETTKNPIMEWIIRYSMRNSDLVHGVSRYTVERAKELGAKRTILIPNGVDIHNFKPGVGGKELRDSLKLGGNKIILTVSRLTPKNGVDLIIRAFPKILKEIPDVKLVIVGGGTQEKELRVLTKKLNVWSNVIFIGDVPHREIPKYMDMADVFIRPSLAEGFGIVFIEAMACETPTIGTRVGGIVDIIKDRENGLLVEPKNKDEIAQAILKILNDKEFALKLAKNGRKTAEEKYSWDKICIEMYEVYEKILEGR